MLTEMTVRDSLRRELFGLLSVNQWASMARTLGDYPLPDEADSLDRRPEGQRPVLFRALPRGLATNVFAHLEPERQRALLHDLTGAEMRDLLVALSPDDRTAMLSPEDLAQARQLLGYPEESVGRLMTPDLVAVRADWTVARALAHVRATGHDAETIDALFVVDERGQLLDDLRLRVRWASSMVRLTRPSCWPSFVP